MSYLIPLEIVLAVLLILVALVVAFVARRRWLSRSAATFECSARLDLPLADGDPSHPTPSPRWALGVARYNGERLEWFRYFSVLLTPRLSWQRSGITVRETRVPDAVEAISLYSSHQIIRIATVGSAGADYELAMDTGSITGLLAWLEAAPPGTVRSAVSPA